jgi:hypothetical protein
MSDTSSNQNKTTYSRTLRPERIDLGDDVAVRNDLVAREHGVSERAVNRNDAKGAPFLFIAGIKYRPIRKYREFLASRVKVRRPSRQERARTGGSTRT